MAAVLKVVVITVFPAAPGWRRGEFSSCVRVKVAVVRDTSILPSCPLACSMASCKFVAVVAASTSALNSLFAKSFAVFAVYVTDVPSAEISVIYSLVAISAWHITVAVDAGEPAVLPDPWSPSNPTEPDLFKLIWRDW